VNRNFRCVYERGNGGVVLRMSTLSHILITQFLCMIPICKYEDVSHECRNLNKQADRIMWYSWFQIFPLFWMSYSFFWVIPRRLNFICRRFRTFCLFHLHRWVGVEWLCLRNVGVFIRENVWLEPFRAKIFPARLPQLFSNLVVIHLLTYEDGTDRLFRNVDI